LSYIRTNFDFIVFAVSDRRPARLSLEFLIEMFEREVGSADALLVPGQGVREQNRVQEKDLIGRERGRLLISHIDFSDASALGRTTVHLTVVICYVICRAKVLNLVD
jgi:hypothetical protein